jgi:hypothetical protein
LRPTNDNKWLADSLKHCLHHLKHHNYHHQKMSQTQATKSTHTQPLPTIGMILPIAGGSSMEFQTKNRRKITSGWLTT